MRLDRHLKNRKLDETIFNLGHDCREYLDEIIVNDKINMSKLPRRGIGWDGLPKSTVLYHMKSHLIDRRPRKADKILHDLFNKAGKKLFGWPIRNGVASTSDESKEIIFGRMNIFLPIGDYEYVYAPDVNDFNDGLYMSIFDSIPDVFSKEIWITYSDYLKYHPAQMEKYLKLNKDGVQTYEHLFNLLFPIILEYVKKNYKNNNLMKAVSMQSEISFKCDSYYLVTDNIMFQEALIKGGWVK